MPNALLSVITSYSIHYTKLYEGRLDHHRLHRLERHRDPDDELAGRSLRPHALFHYVDPGLHRGVAAVRPFDERQPARGLAHRA